MPRPQEYACTFEEAGHRYTDGHGQHHKSVTQLLQDAGCVDFSMIDPLILEAAAHRGKEVHRWTALWDKVRKYATMPFFLEGVPQELHGYLWQYEAFLAQMGFVAIEEETERPRLVDIHGYRVAMTPDRIGHFPDSQRLVVLDLKTGNEVFTAHPLQTAGYSMGMERVMVLAMQHLRCALYLEPDQYRLKFFDHPQDYFAFLDALRGGGEYLNEWMHQRQRGLVA